jgi:hypothetical protein
VFRATAFRATSTWSPEEMPTELNNGVGLDERVRVGAEVAEPERIEDRYVEQLDRLSQVVGQLHLATPDGAKPVR